MTATTELNSEQRAAVESDAPFKLVIAGPGSGKTRTLVAAVAEECYEHNSNQVVVITYTVAAAEELERRLTDELAAFAWSLGFCGTLHAFCLKLAREHSYLGTSSWGVLDDEQREGMVADVLNDLGVKTAIAKVLPLLDTIMPLGPRLKPEQVAVLEYRSRMLSSGLLDFASMLRAGASVASGLGARGRWPYWALFVDEAQDAGVADWACYDAFPCERKFVVGDPDQAVFGFRGGAVRELFIRGRGANRHFASPAASKRL